MTPSQHRAKARSDALAFRIWQYANPREWNVTIAEIADGIGESVNRVRGLMIGRKWTERARVTGTPETYAEGQGNFLASRHIARDVAAGRITNGPSV